MTTRRAGPVEAAVRKDLRRLAVSDRSGALAASALTLARLLDASGDVDPDKRLAPAAQAARELRSTMTELLKNAPRARSGIDELRAKRAGRAKAAARVVAEGG